jgi:hypothetical protein
LATWWIVIGVPAALALIALAVIWALRRADLSDRRRDALLDLAERLGLRFYGDIGPEAVRQFPPSALFEEGSLGYIDNLMAEPRRPPRLILFDYRFNALDPLSGTPWGMEDLYMVAMLQLGEDAPRASLRLFHSGTLGAPVQAGRTQSIAFASDPTFERDFAVAGPDLPRTRELLTEPVRTALREWDMRGPRPVVELMPGWLVVYDETYQADPQVGERANALVAYGMRLVEALSTR